MDGFLEPQEKKSGPNIKALAVGAGAGILLLAGAIWLLTLQPSMEDQKADILAGSFHEGAPEFAAITKDIIISTADDSVESPNAFGSISIYPHGKIRNKGAKVINGLEVNVAIVDSFEKVLKEKRVLVVPTQTPQLGPDQTIDIHLEIPGLNKKDDRANIRWKVTAIRVAN